MRQAGLAAKVGVSQARLAAIEMGQGGGAPLEVWFAIAQALGRYLKFEFARDPQAELVDAGHLAMQELVIRVAKAVAWEVQFEAQSRAWESNRSIDVRLVDRKQRQIVIVECWNTFGNIGAAARSSNAKIRDEGQHAVAIAGEGPPLQVGLVWVVRDTKANRELFARYPGVFESRLPGSSARWLQAMTRQFSPPAEPGLIWCDNKTTRLFARRRTGTGWTAATQERQMKRIRTLTLAFSAALLLAAAIGSPAYAFTTLKQSGSTGDWGTRSSDQGPEAKCGYSTTGTVGMFQLRWIKVFPVHAGPASGHNKQKISWTVSIQRSADNGTTWKTLKTAKAQVGTATQSKSVKYSTVNINLKGKNLAYRAVSTMNRLTGGSVTGLVKIAMSTYGAKYGTHNTTLGFEDYCPRLVAD